MRIWCNLGRLWILYHSAQSPIHAWCDKFNLINGTSRDEDDQSDEQIVFTVATAMENYEHKNSGVHIVTFERGKMRTKLEIRFGKWKYVVLRYFWWSDLKCIYFYSALRRREIRGGFCILWRKRRRAESKRQQHSNFKKNTSYKIIVPAISMFLCRFQKN